MIVGPCKVLLMDEISTGLDSSTTFQIVSCLQQLAHISEYTILVSLLQPAPETYDLFDDIILMGEGKVVYHGPKNLIMTFFESCGFKCPERKGPADFLQEVFHRSLVNKNLTKDCVMQSKHQKHIAVPLLWCYALYLFHKIQCNIKYTWDPSFH